MEERLEQTLPHSIEAERSVLGAMLLENAALEEMLEQLMPGDFYMAAHEHIFAAMRDVALEGGAVDLVTLADRLEKNGKLDAAGGAVYLTELMQFVPTTANLTHYARIVEEHSVKRALIRAGNDMIRGGLDEQKPVEDLLNESEKHIYDISMRKTEDTLVPMSAIVPEAIAMIGEQLANKGKLTGVDTGFTQLNILTNGLQKSDLIIVAARPAMGKSAFAMNIAQHAAVKDNRAVLVFSLEMSREQLVQRMLFTDSSVDSQKVKLGTLSDEETERLLDASPALRRAHINIDDQGGATVASIRSKCRRKQAREGLDLVIIDYMQLMQGTGMGGRRDDNRQQQISDMTRAMKLLARELNVPIMLLAQLNRGPELRQDHHPMISDLRESGSIEQDADLVILLYREGVYNKDANNEAEVIVAKNRHGPTDTVRLAWQGEYTRFRNIAT